jgi:alpha-ketoglutarate-dependent taurine dioxygenase
MTGYAQSNGRRTGRTRAAARTEEVMTAIGSATFAGPWVRQRRDAVLREPHWFPCHGISISEAAAVDEAAMLRERVDDAGLALFQLTRPLDVDEFIALARVLGVPERETDRSLMDRVVSGIILDLKPDSTLPVTEHSQPFTPQPLTYHVEGSRRPLGASPTYLLFQCLERPAVDQGGQTIVRSIDDTLAALTEATQTVLANTVLNPELTTATVIYERGGRRTLNFRDPAPAEFRWRSPYDRAEVVCAFAELLSVIYDRNATVGIPWREGLLVVVDNHRWLHARTSGCAGKRHLQRIRVQQSEGRL